MNMVRWWIGLAGLLFSSSIATAQAKPSLQSLLPPAHQAFVAAHWNIEGLHSFDADGDNQTDAEVRVKNPTRLDRIVCLYTAGEGPDYRLSSVTLDSANLNCAPHGLERRLQGASLQEPPVAIKTISYNAQGQVVRIENGSSSIETYEYHPNGNQRKNERRYSDASGKETTRIMQEWDEQGRIVREFNFSNGVLRNGMTTSYQGQGRVEEKYFVNILGICDIQHSEFSSDHPSDMPTRGYGDEGCDGTLDYCFDAKESSSFKRPCKEGEYTGSSPFLSERR